MIQLGSKYEPNQPKLNRLLLSNEEVKRHGFIELKMRANHSSPKSSAHILLLQLMFLYHPNQT